MKYICKECEIPCEIIVEVGSHTPRCCPYRSQWHAVKWHEAAENLQPTCNRLATDLQDKPLPKLTAEVFDLPDCPEWANYAAVHNGNLVFTDQEPEIGEHGLLVSANDAERIEKAAIIPLKNNKHHLSQLIKRPVKENKLPDWCKQGEWVYYFDEVDGHSYQKIDKIDDKYIYFYRKFDRSKPSDPLVSDRVVYSVFIENTKQARLRPYNADEMKALMGKVVGNEHGNMFLVTAFVADECEVCLDGVVYNADDLLECYTIDNAPCGVLEHLENGEWVE